MYIQIIYLRISVFFHLVQCILNCLDLNQGHVPLYWKYLSLNLNFNSSSKKRNSNLRN